MPLGIHAIADYALAPKDLRMLVYIVLALIAVTVVQTVVSTIFSHSVQRFSATIDTQLTLPALDRLLKVPLSDIKMRPQGEIASQVREISTIRTFLSVGAISAAVDLLFVLVVVSVMLVISPLITAVIASSIPILAGISLYSKPMARQLDKEVASKREHFDALVSEGLRVIETTRFMALEPLWKNRWHGAHADYLHASLKARRYLSNEGRWISTIQRVFLIAVLAIGSWQVISGSLTFGATIACYLLAFRVLGPSARLYQIAGGFIQVRRALENLVALSNLTSEGSIGRKSYRNGELRFEQVTYRYANREIAALRDASFALPRGSFVAILGESGSGKSTIAQLMQRQIEPSAGSITLDRANLDEFDMDQYRGAVLLVSQDASLYSGTVRQNILGKHDRDSLSEQELTNSLSATGADGVIEGLQDGIDTRIRDGYGTLSSGQRQRLILSRAILAKPDILILDEATNALDKDSERDVLQQLRREISKATIVFITHREELARLADISVRIDENGRIHACSER